MLKSEQKCSAARRLSIERERARPERNHIEKAAGHHEVLVEMHHILHVASRQMHAERGAETEQDQQSRGPARHKANEDRRAAKEVDGNRNPHRDLRRRNIEARQILYGAGRVAELKDAVPDKKAAQQKPRQRGQVVSGHVCGRGRHGIARMGCRGHSASPAGFAADSGATPRCPA